MARPEGVDTVLDVALRKEGRHPVLDVALMIEGQQGLNWPRWQRLGRAAEELGFAGLYRSDHFTDPDGPEQDALELWASLTWLAAETQRIEFGPLVSPVSFRHPVITAWTASAVDSLAGGRLRLGVGAGWQDREHDTFGFDLLDLDGRFARLQEALEVLTRLLRSDQPATFRGSFYRLDAALLRPRSPRPGGPPITIGGNGEKRTLPLVARYADEWNGLGLTPDRFGERSRQLDALIQDAGRVPSQVRRSLMTRVVVGRTDAELRAKLDGQAAAELRGRGAIVGTPNAIVEQLGTLADAGVARVMLQWLDLDDIDGIEALATSVLPQLSQATR